MIEQQEERNKENARDNVMIRFIPMILTLSYVNNKLECGTVTKFYSSSQKPTKFICIICLHSKMMLIQYEYPPLLVGYTHYLHTSHETDTLYSSSDGMLHGQGKCSYLHQPYRIVV